MKIAFYIEGNPNNPGGYNQIINTTKFLGYFLNTDKENYVFIVNDNNLLKKLKKFEIDAILYKKTLLNKLIDYLFGLTFLYQLLVTLNLKHSFLKFLKKQNIELINFLSPSNLALFCEDINFVINVWDLDHKKNSIFPEHKENYTYEKREKFLNNIIFKAFKIIVAHKENKKDLINLYNCDEKKIEIQSFIPYLPSLQKEELIFKDKFEQKLFESLPEDKKIVIYPATFWPHKNHKYIIDTVLLLKKNNINNFYFVLCGSDRGTYSYIKKLISSYELDNHIKIFSLVSDFFLKRLYEKCFAVVMPTDTGPTNLPLYEAMYFKKPIFYSKNILNDNDLDNIIIPIDTNHPNSLFSSLNSISETEIKKKTDLGQEYYKKFCSKDKLYQTYKNIINEYKKKVSQWKG